MSRLSSAQRGSVLASVRHLDDLLGETLRILRESGSETPFARHVPDATPVQVRVIEDSVGRFRGLLVRFLDDFGIERPASKTSALEAARVHLMFAETALEDLLPPRLRGYGVVAPEAGAELEGVVAELRALLRRMNELLGERAGADLAARLERLPDDGIPLARLRELERIVTQRGLTELRPALGRLVERLEAPSLEIGVFGRVSSGKSSLLNRFLGRELLPVGVVPVTALPVRIAYGEEPGLVVTAADGKSTREPLDRLAAYATEKGNPGNAKRVARLSVALPSPRLYHGVTLVDTPGLGSLATAGAEETRAYLPRCDLGVVLVDAGSVLAPEDLAVVQALLAAGAWTQVLLSKADALAPADREELASYVRRQLCRELGTEVAVHVVSVVGSEAGLADAWFEASLEAFLAKRRELATASMARKAEVLRRAATLSLRARLAAAARSHHSEQAARPARFEGAQRLALRQLDGARWRLEERAREAASPGPVVAAAAGEIGRRWREERFCPELPVEALAAALRERARRAAEAVVAGVGELREALAASLATEDSGSTASGSAADDDGLPRPPAVPLFDPEPACRGLALGRPGLLGWSRPLLARWALDRLEEQAGERVAEALGFYRRLLGEWVRRAVGELRKAFEAGVAERGVEAAAAGVEPDLAPGEAVAIAADLERLERPPERSGTA